MSDKIRKITIINFVPHRDERGIATGILLPLNLIVGVEHSLPLDGDNIREKKKIHSIEEGESYYLVYVQEDTASQLWQKLPKNNQTYIEYAID